MSWNDDDLTPAEEARFRELPRIAPVDDLAEERTVRALRAEGLLRPLPETLPVQRRRPLWIPLQLAAGLALFVTGVAYGRRAAPDAPDQAPPSVTLRSASPAEEVQRTGSAYVEALARLGTTPAAHDTLIATTEAEVATVTLRAAAMQVARFEIDSAMAKRITLRLQPAPPVVWF